MGGLVQAVISSMLFAGQCCQRQFTKHKSFSISV